MPAFHSDELNNRTLDDPFFQTLSDSRQSQENAALKTWPHQQPTVRTNYETTPPRTPTDSFNSMNDDTTPEHGGIFTETGLSAVPNGRPVRNSWEDRLVRNTGALSINGGVNGNTEKGRKSPASQNGLSKSERNSFGLSNGGPLLLQSAVAEVVTTSQSANGYSEGSKRLSPPPSSYNPQSTGALTYTSSLVATPNQIESPPRSQNASTHRLSSSPDYHPKTSGVAPPAPITGSLPHPAGPPQLKHRHTLQVPKIGPPRASIDETAMSTGRFSPTIASSMRRGSLSLNRRNTQSIHSNLPHEDIAQDEEALRWAEAIRQKRASKRKRRDEEDEDRVVVGTKVDQNHVNWVTAYNMLTGIRFTVSRTNAKLDRPLTDSDFIARHKFSFDM
jgi:1-phosphatidylinositol-4-phosphate 5-kinase